MESRHWKILLVDDDEDDYILTRALLSEAKGVLVELKWVRIFEAAKEWLCMEDLDAILMDYDLGEHNGIELIRLAAAQNCKAPILLLTGHGSYELDIEAMQAGAVDYLAKSEITAPLLERTIRYAIERKQTEEALRKAHDESELFQAVQRELAERKRAEIELRTSEAMFAQLFESAPDATVLVDQAGRILRLNRQTEARFGYSPDELIGKPVEILLPKRFHKKHTDLRASYYALPTTRAMGFGLELYAIQKDGREFPVDITLSPLHNERSLQVICVIHDITQRKMAEQALGESEARFRTIFEESATGIELLDLDGLIFASNQALQEMLGYTREELLGMCFSDLTEPVDTRPNFDLFGKLLTGQHTNYRIEQRYRQKTGHFIWVRLTVSMVHNEKGEPQFVIGMVENIHERRQMEGELAEVQRRLFDSAEGERLQLAQELHDGPLQDLYGATYQVEALREALTNPKSLDQLHSTQASLHQVIEVLRSICRDLRPPTLAPFGLEKAIRSHASNFRQEHLEINLHLDLAADGQILPDRVRLALFRIYQQALANVARHAHASHVYVLFSMDPETVLLEVQDNGRGFEVPERWVTLAREGHLGLVGASERAGSIGGSLKVESQPGEGTTVRVTAPLQIKSG